MSELTREERALARDAAKRRAAGKSPSAEQTRALKKLQRIEREEDRLTYFKECPQWFYREMIGGRQRKVLQDLKALYGIPCTGRIIDVGACLLALHNFIAEYGHKVVKGEADDSDLIIGSGNSPSQERFRSIKADMAQIDLETKRGNIVSREDVRMGLGVLSGVLRDTAEQLEREFGEEAYRIMQKAFDEVERTIKERFSDDTVQKSN